MRLILLLSLLFLTSCAAWQEMGETGEPPVTWVNRYEAITHMACVPKAPRSVWNYIAGLILAVTGNGVDVSSEHEEN